MPRLVAVILVAAVIYVLFTTVVPLPAPFNWLLLLALVVWVVIELLAVAGYSFPYRR